MESQHLRKLSSDKRADFASIVFVVVLIFAIGFVFFLTNHINHEILTELESTINDSGRSDTQAHATTVDLQSTNDSRLWDWAFFGVYMGVFIVLGATAYAVRISPIFYWIYAILALIVIALAVILSNAWQDLAADSEFTTTLTRFPIMNALLGNYFPMSILIMIIITMIILFAKPPGQEGYI